MYVWCVFMYVSVRLYMCMCVFIYVYVSVCVYVCVYVGVWGLYLVLLGLPPPPELGTLVLRSHRSRGDVKAQDHVGQGVGFYGLPDLQGCPKKCSPRLARPIPH